jgi:hypothetical protein
MAASVVPQLFGVDDLLVGDDNLCSITMALFIHCFTLCPILLSGQITYVGYYLVYYHVAR